MGKAKKNILVTGGAGFIGSNLVRTLLSDERTERVRVLDNLSNGHYSNLSELESHPDFEFVEGDIRDRETCFTVCKDMDLVNHQAALGSVPRSIKDPLTTNEVNVTGTLNIFHAAKESKIERVVFAASSSTYGDNPELPKKENVIGKPLSPYAVTKYVNELYADVYSNSYDHFKFIGLRYFNVFGPRQDPNGAYAAVIPLFMKAALEMESPVINGDGTNSRDFTYIDNAVQANMLALFTENKDALNNIYNVACGNQTSLNELWSTIIRIAGIDVKAIYGPERPGDISHSLADISRIKNQLDYRVMVDVESGLRKTYKWFQDQLLRS